MTTPLIVLEGPDGAGKTFLAQELVKKLDAFYVHDRYSPKQWLKNSGMLRLGVKKYLQGVPVVFDRHWVGDNIYSAVFRPGKSGPWVRRMDSVMQRYGVCYVMCLPDVNRLEEEFQKLRLKRPEMYTSIKEAAVRYHDLYYGSIVRPFDGDYVEQQSSMYPWHDSKRNVFVYDRFRQGKQASVRWLMKSMLPLAQERHDQIRKADPLPRDLDSWELSGSLLDCRALLVGERGKHPDAAANWPFYSDRECSAFLTASLQKARVCETHVALTNAYSIVGNDVNNCMKILRWIKSNRPTVRVIALGKTAENVIKYHGYRPDSCIPHPQWARRFLHHGDWWLQLRRAIYGEVVVGGGSHDA